MRRKILLVFFNLALLALLLFVVDVLVGFLYPRLAPAYGRKNLDILLGKVNTTKALNERPHPYMLWENTPEYISEAGIKQTNKQGYRNESDISPLPGPDTLRILTLGGSTTYGYLLDGPEDAWPSQLEQILNRHIGEKPLQEYRRVEVINGSLLYGTSAELLLHYLFRDRYLGAQIVVLHTGENDAGPLLFDDYNPEYTHFRPGWSAPSYSLRRGELPLIKHSNIVKFFYACWLKDSVALPYINKQSKSFDLAESYYTENAKRNQPVGFERNLDLLLRNIVADGATPILFPGVFPTEKAYQELQPEAAKRAAYTKNIHAATPIAMEKDREVMFRLSEKYKIPFIELSPDNIPAQDFLDHVHLSKQGEAIKAAFVADNILRLRQMAPNQGKK